MRPVLALIHLTLAEARAARLHWVILVVLISAAALGQFTAALALADAAQVKIATTSATVRVGLVFVIVVFAVHSVTRERLEGHWRFIFARPLARRHYVAAKIFALAFITLCAAIAGGAMLWSIGGSNLIWTLLLWAEAMLAAMFGLACALSLSHALPAIAATAAFYLLARSSGALLALTSESVASWFGLLLPRLDLFARSEWLLYPDAPVPPGLLALQFIAYTCVLTALAVADLERRPL
jgi:hypothetical protein